MGAGALSLPRQAYRRRADRPALRVADRRCGHCARGPFRAEWLARGAAGAARHQGRLHAAWRARRADVHRIAVRGSGTVQPVLETLPRELEEGLLLWALPRRRHSRIVLADRDSGAVERLCACVRRAPSAITAPSSSSPATCRCLRITAARDHYEARAIRLCGIDPPSRS